MSLIAYFVATLAVIVGAIYLYLKKRFSYWKNENVPHIAAKSYLGAIKDISEGAQLGLLLSTFYNETKKKAPFCGFYLLSTPIALATDLELIKNILIKDSANFLNRALYVNERDDPLSAHLFSLEDQKWKQLRSKLTPTFTSGKMKFMYPTILEVGEHFINKLKSLTEQAEVLEVKDLLGRFTTDVIGTCAFGIECNSLDDPNAKFRKYGLATFIDKRPMRTQFLNSFRSLGRTLRMEVLDPEISEFFLEVVRDTVQYREENNIRRNDFLDMLIEMKNSTGANTLTLNELSAQCFIFFLAGFETSSTLLTFALYELALNPEIQEQLREHINEILEKHDGVFSYDAMIEMKYLDKVLNETLRKYPPLPVHFRITAQDYKVEGTKYTIRKGTKIWVPVYGIQHDPEIYPDPEKFDPERFSPENVKTRHIAAWTPFGEGPRVCIGLRFGMMQSRIAIVKILQNFRITTCDKTPIPIQFDAKSFFTMTSVGGMRLKFEKLSN